jgi:midasin (ATPase involved in ribosome maturation)
MDKIDFNSYLLKKKNFEYIKRDVDDSLEFWAGIGEEGIQRAHIALIGTAGSGKNTMVEEYAFKNNLPYLCIPCDDSMIFTELLGSTQLENGTTYFKEGIACQFFTRPSVVQIDEPNSLPPSRLFMLHELFQNRRLFIKDTTSNNSIITLHPECRLFTSMNPCMSSYSGTNRLNVALGNRTVFIDVPSFKVNELPIETGSKGLNDKIKQLYKEVNSMIDQQRMRVVFSVRNIRRICEAIRVNYMVRSAVMEGFVNSALATAGEEEKKALENIGLTVFGEDWEVTLKEKIVNDKKKTEKAAKKKVEVEVKTGEKE